MLMRPIFPRLWPQTSRRYIVWGVALALVSAGVTFGVVRSTRPDSHAAAASPLIGAALLTTVAHPLADGAQQMTLAEAAAAFGASLTLPNTSLVHPSDAGPVWELSSGGSATGSGASKTVAITFPAQGLIVEYLRPALYSNPSSGYQELSSGIPWSNVVDLSGTAALAIRENSDETGTNFGVVAFEFNGNEVRVMGHDDEATLEAIAKSILSPSTS
jgi:hypothetical protein